MALANPLRKVASKLMAKFGGEATIRRITVGAYNTSTGTAAETTSDTECVVCWRMSMCVR
jgi:hypothetical protein